MAHKLEELVRQAVRAELLENYCEETLGPERQFYSEQMFVGMKMAKNERETWAETAHGGKSVERERQGQPEEYPASLGLKCQQRNLPGLAKR